MHSGKKKSLGISGKGEEQADDIEAQQNFHSQIKQGVIWSEVTLATRCTRTPRHTENCLEKI